MSHKFEHAPILRRHAYNTAARVAARVAGKPGARAALRRVLKSVGAGLAYATLIEPHWIECTHIDVPIPGLPQWLEGYRIVHLSDIHHTVVQGTHFLRRVVERANSLDPDLVALTGDFVTHDPLRMSVCVQALSHLRAPDGLWAVRGNHDARLPLDVTMRLMERVGIRLLENRHDAVAPARVRAALGTRPGRRFAQWLTVAGVGDLWTAKCSPGEALTGADPRNPTLLLSHNPAVSRILPARPRVDLVLCGHTHGGQVRPFDRSYPVFSGGETAIVSGLAQDRGTTFYVSRGVGTSALHVRWNCRPEIALLVLRCASGTASNH